MNVVFNWFGARAKLHAFVPFKLLFLEECAYFRGRERERLREKVGVRVHAGESV